MRGWSWRSAVLPGAVALATAGSALTGLAPVAQAAVAQAARLGPVCPAPTRPGQMTCMAVLPSGREAAADTGAAGPPARAYAPAVLQEAYRLGRSARTAPAGGTDTVALVDAYNDPRAGADLAVYRREYGLPACTSASGCLTITGSGGGSRLPASDPSGGWELEESLDLDMVSAICPYCHLLLVEAKSDSISSLAAAEHYAVRHASAVSNSWGSGSEFTGENSYNSDFRRSGVAVTAAAGDDGYGTQYPAASRYVTAVGGTRLRHASATSPGIQTAWSGTGSGCTSLAPQPSWQARAPGLPATCRTRLQNDLAAVADPDPGVAIYDSVPYQGADGAATSGWAAVGGTSAAAPIIAAAFALADIATGHPGTGLVAGTRPASYPYLHPGAFTDVTAGSDGSCPGRAVLCRAEPGYDGPTGLGVPDGVRGLRWSAKRGTISRATGSGLS